jgi:hypothetical protein
MKSLLGESGREKRRRRARSTYNQIDTGCLFVSG